MVMETIRIPLAYQSFQLFKYILVTVVIDNTLITSVLQKTYVALENGLTRELNNEELKDCVFVEGIYICNEIGGTFKKNRL